MTKKILILPGDGIGQEVTSSMNEVLHYLIGEQGLDFEISEKKVGGSSYDEFGKPLTEETLEIARNSDAILFSLVSKDIITNNGKIFDWILAPPELFPTMLLTYFISFFQKKEI